MAVKRKETRARREKTFLFSCRVTVRLVPILPCLSRLNFVSSMLGYFHSLRSKRLSNIGRAVLGNAEGSRVKLALLAFPYQGRSQDFFRGTHNLPNSVGNNCHPHPTPCPIKTVAAKGHSQTDFHDRRGKFCPSRAVGGMLSQKMLKPRGSEMLFSALFIRSFFKNLI